MPVSRLEPVNASEKDTISDFLPFIKFGCRTKTKITYFYMKTFRISFTSLLLLQFAMQKISVPKELGSVASLKWKRKSVNEKKWMRWAQTAVEAAQ